MPAVMNIQIVASTGAVERYFKKYCMNNAPKRERR
jgi:hypothetical protein